MKNARNDIIKNVKKLLENNRKETLDKIFSPLNGMEQKVTLRQQTIIETIENLKTAKSQIDGTIKCYETELESCGKFLKLVTVFKERI